MARYIDADKFHEWVYPNWSYCAQNDDDFHDAIDAQPTADVAPVVHAHWIDACDGWHTICSNCGEKYYDDLPRIAKCCPHCGAKMDEEVE